MENVHISCSAGLLVNETVVSNKPLVSNIPLSISVIRFVPVFLFMVRLVMEAPSASAIIPNTKSPPTGTDALLSVYSAPVFSVTAGWVSDKSSLVQELNMKWNNKGIKKSLYTFIIINFIKGRSLWLIRSI